MSLEIGSHRRNQGQSFPELIHADRLTEGILIRCADAANPSEDVVQVAALRDEM